MRQRFHCSTDLTDLQWQTISRFVPPRSRRGRPRIDRRWVVNAIMFVVKTGCQWRLLPQRFPAWSTVYGVFREWQRQGLWQKMHDALRRLLRKQLGRRASPTAAIIDSQSIRTAEGGAERGYDGAKRITGRKRHIVVDTLGMLLMVSTHAADFQDQDGAPWLLEKLASCYGSGRLQVLFADSAYARDQLPEWVESTFGYRLEVVARPAASVGFTPLPKRWIVERTFAWLGRYRRLSKDYEKTIESSQTMVYLAMIRLMLNRIEKLRK